MKASKKSIALILAGTMMLGGAGAALAYGGGYHDRGGCGHHGGGYSHGTPMRALGQLDLSDEQRDQIKSLFRDQRDAMRDTMDKMQDNRQALRDAVQNNADEEKLRSLAKKQGDLVTEMIMARSQMRAKINGVLTDEQKAELQKIRKQRMDYRRDRYDDDDERRW